MVSSNTEIALSSNEAGQIAIAKEIHARFHAMKTYGKEPESLSSITATMLRDLSDFPADKILKAFKLHAQRSEEFPTTANIYGLIKRNGKPPLSKETFIAISKKHGEDRTSEDWQYLRDYQAEQNDGWEEVPDQAKSNATLNENTRLRQELIELKREVKRLSDLLHEERMRKGIEKPKPDLMESLTRTINAMRTEGAKQEDIAEFAVHMALMFIPVTLSA